MQLDVDTVSKIDLNLLAAGPKAAESVLTLKTGGFKIRQISMLIDALQRIMHFYIEEKMHLTVHSRFYARS